ncbi:recd-like dna helicase yrrc [hydrocarbon metagenome]|uniref:Recd-like dna helicase yrrc n=1 Tax=hydrocarbon metagenome TaxID=938273 RepID=A0A0W8G7T3_9ZZZZ
MTVTEIAAEVQCITYYSEETNYLVARVKAKGEPGTVSIVGSMAKLAPGEMVRLTGQWVEHPRFGRQFQVQSAVSSMPATVNGIRRYLASGQIKGVGGVLAERMVDMYGASVLDILENEPDKLLRVEGLGRKKLSGILSSWNEHREVRSLILFLQTFEISTGYAAKIFKLYGNEAIARLKANPYDLIYEIRGVGFRTADRMALKLGLDPGSRDRMEAAVVFALFTASEQGHLFFPAEDLYERIAAMLDDAADPITFESALAALEEKKRIKTCPLPEQDIPRAVYLHHLYGYEREIADRLWGLVTHGGSTGVLEKARALLPKIEAEAGLTLSEEQRRAVQTAIGEKVFVLTGGPGTGKTTITRMVVRALDKLGHKVKLAAPTGRAAKRMSEATGYPAATLHRLLQYSADGSFAVSEDNKLKADALVVDEASMLDVRLCAQMLRAMPLTGRLILVGDVNQLPSVGPGNVLADILDSQAVPAERLTHIYRQAQQSLIVVNSHRVNSGQFPLQERDRPEDADFFWVEMDDPGAVKDKIVELVSERIPRSFGLDPVRDIQVLSPMHKGEVGTMALNDALRARLNPAGPEIVRGNAVFRLGDKVLQTRNNYEKDVFNGDLGLITAVDPEEGELMVDFDGRDVAYDRTDLDELSPAYAVSVHKSQGSEYPAVVVPLLTQHYVMLRRNLIYTALTRARKLAVLIAPRRALAVGLGRSGSEKRFTHLRFRLQEKFNR